MSEKWRNIVPIVIFNIILPTVDVGSDLYFIVSKNLGPHPYDLQQVTIAMVFFFLLNYIMCFVTWIRLEKDSKIFTFIYPLLNLYPQFCKYRMPIQAILK